MLSGPNSELTGPGTSLEITGLVLRTQKNIAAPKKTNPPARPPAMPPIAPGVREGIVWVVVDVVGGLVVVGVSVVFDVCVCQFTNYWSQNTGVIVRGGKTILKINVQR